jgi:hypothetical protein
LLVISLKLTQTLSLPILPVIFEWKSLFPMHFCQYNCLKQHCFGRISASIWLRLKMHTTTHLSDVTLFLMRPQNAKSSSICLFCCVASLLSSVC